MAAATVRLAVSAVALTTISIGVVVQGGANPHEAAASWELVGGSRSNARYSALTQINTQTISKIGATWMSETFGANASSRATPIVKDGLMFVTAGPSIYAFNAKSGDTIWRYDSRGETGAPGAAASPSKEGLALGDGLVFAGMANGDVLAIEET